MSVLHQAVLSATFYLPRPGAPALLLPTWLNVVNGWLTMAEIVWGRVLPDADQNHFLLELLGNKGKRLLNWDCDTMKTELSTAMHASFHQNIRLHLLEPTNASTMTTLMSGRPLPG